MQELKIKTVIRCQEMSIGVASVQRKEFTTASAVYYRNALRQRALQQQQQQQQQAKHLGPMSGINESGTVSEFWNSIWVLEQCLISGTLEQQWLNSGHKSVTVSICRNSTSLNHYHQRIYVHVHIILQCPLQMKNCCQTNTTRQHECFRCQSRLNVVTRMFSSSLLLSLAVGRQLIFISHFF